MREKEENMRRKKERGRNPILGPSYLWVGWEQGCGSGQILPGSRSDFWKKQIQPSRKKADLTLEKTQTRILPNFYQICFFVVWWIIQGKFNFIGMLMSRPDPTKLSSPDLDPTSLKGPDPQPWLRVE